MTSLSGTVAILTRGDGTVLATAADFEPKSPGYCSKEDAQRGRSRLALANAYIREWCGPDIADVMRGYDAEKLLADLCRVKGYKITTAVVEVLSDITPPQEGE